jgi:hypothetical protein
MTYDELQGFTTRYSLSRRGAIKTLEKVQKDLITIDKFVHHEAQQAQTERERALKAKSNCRILGERKDKIIFLHRSFMSFLATVCACLVYWTFHLSAQLHLSYIQNTELKASLVLSNINKKEISFTSSFPFTIHHDTVTNYQNFSDKTAFENSATKEENINKFKEKKAKTKDKSRTNTKTKTASNAHSVQEKRCPSFVVKPAYNMTLEECRFLMNAVLPYDNTGVLNHTQICKLKFLADKYIFWRCDNVAINLTQSIYAYHDNHSVVKLQNVCSVLDDDNDHTLTPDELCVVKDFIYHL